jgi:pseudouridylate synthase
VVGLSKTELEAIAADPSADKASLWNLGAIVAQRRSAGTTVAATSFLAVKAGIRVFATGGIGGVHPQPFDESADLIELSRTPILVVSAGPKSILDLSATMERLESFGVALLGFRTDKMPAFHSPSSPYPLPARVESPQEAAAAFMARSRKGWTLGRWGSGSSRPPRRPLEPGYKANPSRPSCCAACRSFLAGRPIQ